MLQEIPLSHVELCEFDIAVFFSVKTLTGNTLKTNKFHWYKQKMKEFQVNNEPVYSFRMLLRLLKLLYGELDRYDTELKINSKRLSTENDTAI